MINIMCHMPFRLNRGKNSKIEILVIVLKGIKEFGRIDFIGRLLMQIKQAKKANVDLN